MLHGARMLTTYMRYQRTSPHYFQKYMIQVIALLVNNPLLKRALSFFRTQNRTLPSFANLITVSLLFIAMSYCKALCALIYFQTIFSSTNLENPPHDFIFVTISLKVKVSVQQGEILQRYSMWKISLSLCRSNPWPSECLPPWGALQLCVPGCWGVLFTRGRGSFGHGFDLQKISLSLHI